MGAVVNETGDKGKSFSDFGQAMPFLLIADDAIVAFFI